MLPFCCFILIPFCIWCCLLMRMRCPRSNLPCLLVSQSMVDPILALTVFFSLSLYLSALICSIYPFETVSPPPYNRLHPTWTTFNKSINIYIIKTCYFNGLLCAHSMRYRINTIFEHVNHGHAMPWHCMHLFYTIATRTLMNRYRMFY